jgi:hypothetical protein
MSQVLKLITLMGTLLFLYGCEGLREHKWLENNTFYSSRAPSIEIQVSQHLQEGTETSTSTITEDSNSSINSTWVRTDNYSFWDKEGKQQLVILVQNLNDTKWSMEPLNFSYDPAFLDVGEETIAGWRFDTGIYVNGMPQQSFLVKIYSRNFGNRTRLSLWYLEGVDDSWNTPDLVLISEKQAFLEAFNKRALESFIIRPYSGIKHPDQRSDVIVSKQ